jgi:hypothetical protein
MSTESAAATPAAPAQPAPAVTQPASPAAAPAAPAATPAVVQLMVQPAAPAAIPAPAAPAVQPPAPDPDKEPEKEPGWLKARLDRAAAAERKALLKSYGVESEDEIKQAVDARRAAVEAEKTAQTQAAERAALLETQGKRVAVLEADLRAEVEAKMATVPQNIRDAVMDLAGDNVSAQLKALRRLAPLAASPPAPALAAPSAAPPVVASSAAPAAPAEVLSVVQLPDGRYAQVLPYAAPPAAPAAPPTGTQAIPPTPISTAPAPGGPSPVGAPPVNAWEMYQTLRSQPAAAAEFLHKNAAAIERDMPKR